VERWNLGVVWNPAAEASNPWAIRLRPAKSRCYTRMHPPKAKTGCPGAIPLCGRRGKPASSENSPIRRQKEANTVPITGKGLRGTPPQYITVQVLSSNERLSRQDITLEWSSFGWKTGELEAVRRIFEPTCSCHTSSTLDEVARPSRPEMESPGTVLPQSHPPVFPAAGEPPQQKLGTALRSGY
jgi:hypothetical protein